MSSISIHSKGIPLLIEPNVLRKRGLGQIDLSIINKDKIILYECKSHVFNVQQNQLKRLRSSLKFLCTIFHREGLIKVIRPFAKTRR